MIKFSCKEVKKCAKCGKDIYTTDPRKNRNDGNSEHLKGQCNITM
jgi:hypothetical protein